MKYLYYPGCSLEGTASEYDASVRAVMHSLGAELAEIEDWTCCGASAGDAISYLLSLALPARNLAIAEKQSPRSDVLVPCNACYLNLKRVDDHMNRNTDIREKIKVVLAEENLRYGGGIKVRHLLDVLVRDFGPESIAANVKNKLSGMRIVPYYGCQFARPYSDADDPQFPVSMEPLIRALGAEVHPWTMGAKCCGAGLMTTKSEVALKLVANLLDGASEADCILTICPMCQMNLDSQQNKASRLLGKDMSKSVLYVTQLMGIAFGLSDEELMLKKNLAVTAGFQAKLRSASSRA